MPTPLMATPALSNRLGLARWVTPLARRWGLRGGMPYRVPWSKIRGFGLAVTGGYYTSFYDPETDYLGFRSTREAAAVAYAQAGIEDARTQLDVQRCD